MFRSAIVLGLLVLVTACATTRYDAIRAIQAAANRGDYATAERELTALVARGDDDALALLGSLYIYKGERQKGLGVLRLAARRGNRHAQQWLAEYGEQVPSVDLAPRQREPSDLELLGRALQGFSQGFNAGRPPETTTDCQRQPFGLGFTCTTR